MKVFLTLAVSLLFLPSLFADIKVEKQKLKVSLEYENFVDTEQNEIRTSGLKATYLLHARTQFGRVLVDLDYQTGAKTNFYRHFNAGDLPALIWSNRAVTNLTIPFGKCYVGGSFYFRNKIFSHVSPEDQFVDIFGGVGFNQVSGAIVLGWQFRPNWEIVGNLQASGIQYSQFEESNSHWDGASLRLSRKISKVKLNLDYRTRSVDYNRPVTVGQPPVIVPETTIIEQQHDHFQEFGAGVEFLRTIYFSGGYYYQINNSNNPGFAFHNHRITLLVGTELAKDWQFQAYGILQRENFDGQDGILLFPVLIDESDNNTMAASLVKLLPHSREIEIGMQRYTYTSSFTQLNASKYILYIAFNFRF